MDSAKERIGPIRAPRTINVPSHLSAMLRIEDVITKLGVSRATVERRVLKGYFHPIRAGGVLLFNPEEVDAESVRVRESNKLRNAPIAMALAAERMTKARPQSPQKISSAATVPSPVSNFPSSLLSYTGEQCADAFKLFSEGRGPRYVIQELKVTCEVGEHLWKKYRALGDEILLDQDNLARIRSRLDWFETPPTARGLVAAIDRFVLKGKEDKGPKEVPLSEEEKKSLEELNSPVPSEE